MRRRSPVAGDRAPHPEFARSVEGTMALLREYLHVTGLSAAAAREAMEWARDRPIFCPETVTAAQLATIRDYEARFHGGGLTDADHAAVSEIERAVTAASNALREEKLAALLTVNGVR